MGGIFGSTPTPPPPPAAPPPPAPAPTLDSARSKRQNQDKEVGRMGRAATILTGEGGDLTPTKASGKELLGN